MNNNSFQKIRIAFTIFLYFQTLCIPTASQTTRKLERPIQSVDGEKRIALVIGNARYTKAKPLLNPANDAADIASKLRELGFEVIGGATEGIDLKQSAMESLIARFGSRLSETKGVGLFYYAGHGITSNGQNYLIPVDADIPDEDLIKYKAVPVGYVLDKMAAARNSFNLVILDACRNNPFAPQWRTVRDASDSKGLANSNPPKGTLVLYATQPGSVAIDGAVGSRNGVFTGALLKNLDQPDVELDRLVKLVARDVETASNDKQSPWKEGLYSGDFYFRRSALTDSMNIRKTVPDSQANALIEAQQEQQAWELVKNSSDPGDFRLFLTKFPSGANFSKARIRLEELAWQSAKAADSKDGLKAYLDEFPTGANSATARIRLGQLESSEGSIASPLPPGGTEATAYSKTRKSASGIELVWIPPGEYLMGSSLAQISANQKLAKKRDQNANEELLSTEMQQQLVTIPNGFWMGRFEVTQQQWRSLMGTVPSGCYGTSDLFGDTRPVVCVSWKDANEFIAKLNENDTEFEYRLPSEIEWEYAARGGTTTRFFWGDDRKYDQICRYANGADKSTSVGWRNKACRDGYLGTAPVGSFQPNSFGLYDTSGNVWEFTADIFVDSHASAGDGQRRVIRGGNWQGSPESLGSASRGWVEPADSNLNIGLRLVARAK